MAHPPPHPLTIDTLIDDCLVPILTRTSFTEQMRTLPLTSARWEVLLDRVHLSRTKLVLWNSAQCPRGSFLKDQLFSYLSPAESLPYTTYLSSLFDCPTGIGHTNKLDRLHTDFYLHSIPLDDSFIRQCTVKFPLIVDLSLVHVVLTPKSVLLLLGHYQGNLQSLMLAYPWYTQTNGETSKRGDIYQKVLAIINCMSSLRQLALYDFQDRALLEAHDAQSTVDIVSQLSTVLPQLEAFKIGTTGFDVNSAFQCFNENKLRRLHLSSFAWRDSSLFSRLVVEKSGLRRMTHLAVGHFWGLQGETNEEGVTLYHLQQIVEAFPELVHLEITSATPLIALLPALCQLKVLTTFKYIFTLPVSSMVGMNFIRPWNAKQSRFQLTQYAGCLDSLQVLTLQRVHLEGEFLTLLGPLCPKVERLYLEDCQFYLSKEKTVFTLPADRPGECPAKRYLQTALSTFESLPKMQDMAAPPTG